MEINILHIIPALVNTGHIEALYKLLLTYKELEEILSQMDNLIHLFTINKMNKYYNINNVNNFKNLYQLYNRLSMCKYIYKHIKYNFTINDFNKLRETTIVFLGPYDNYKDFMDLQWYTLLQISIDELYVINYLINTNLKYTILDIDTMIKTPIDCIIFDHLGDLNFVTPK